MGLPCGSRRGSQGLVWAPLLFLPLGRGHVERCPPSKHEDHFVVEDRGPRAFLVGHITFLRFRQQILKEPCQAEIYCTHFQVRSKKKNTQKSSYL